MTVTCGRTLPAPLAYFDHDSSSWKMCEGSLLLEDQPSLATLPLCGMTRDGWLYELPTLATATAANASSSLVPTPMASDAASTCNATATRHRTPPTGVHPGVTLTDFTRLLPTPTSAAADGGNLSRSGARSNELLLPGLVKTFLPTPRTSDANGGGCTVMAGSTSARLLPTPTTDDANNVTRKSGTFDSLARTCHELG